jgi:hypothetical protein
VAIALGLPTVTVRRVLEDLAAYGLIERQTMGKERPICGLSACGTKNKNAEGNLIRKTSSYTKTKILRIFVRGSKHVNRLFG